MAGLGAARAVLWMSFPFLVYAGLEHIEPRYLGLCLLAFLALRNRRTAMALFPAGQGLAIVFVAACLVGVLYISNDERLLRLYPALVNLALLTLFGYSLLRPPSMIERFARLEQPDLSPAGVTYTRRVTWLWCVFLAANGSVAAYTAWFASRGVWALYNGLIAYLLIGAMLGGERLYRHFLQADEVTP